MSVVGSFDEFVTLPDNKKFNVEEPKTKSVEDHAVTNGEIIAEAIRTRDNVLKFEMERRFQAWCSETHHSVYSAGDKKFWKSQRFEK